MQVNKSTSMRFLKCCMPQCANERFDLVHKVPRNLVRQQIWLKALRIPALAALPQNKLTRCVFLCARHFRPEDYVFAESRSLNMLAVPSLNLMDLSQLEACRQTKTIDAPLTEQALMNVSVVEQDSTVEETTEAEALQETAPPEKKSKLSKEAELRLQYPSIAKMEEELFKEEDSDDDGEDNDEEDNDEEEIEEDQDDNDEEDSDHELQQEVKTQRLAVAASLVDYNISLTDDRRLQVTYQTADGAEDTLWLEVLWIRMQCRCSKCFDTKTSSSQIVVFELPSRLQIEMATLQETTYELEVEWNDGHKSTYLLPQLIELHDRFIRNRRLAQPTTKLFLWSSSETTLNDDFCPLQSNDLLSSAEIARNAFECLQRVGVLIIQMPPKANLDPLQQQLLNELLLRRLLPHLPPHTGALLREKRSDFVASRTTPHTNCSFDASLSDCGLQVLSVSSHASQVKLTLVDGFQAVQQLNASTRRFLSVFPVSMVYRNSTGLEHAVHAPLIEISLKDADVVKRINCALYHLSPTMAQQHFLVALKEYTRVLCDRKHQWTLSLAPDMLVILDNWRICWQLQLCAASETTAAPTLDCIYIPRQYFISRVSNFSLSQVHSPKSGCTRPNDGGQPRTMANSEWMTSLPEQVRNMSIINLAIPGSHNSMTYGIDSSSTVAPDADASTRRLNRLFPCMVRRWAKTQSATASQQLELGVRYFDLRVCQRNEQFYYAHGLLAMEIFEPLAEIKMFLDMHLGEMVVLDFQHFYAMTPVHHSLLHTRLLEFFGPRLYSSADGALAACTLERCAVELGGRQVVLIYRRCPLLLPKEFWPSHSWPTPWPNVASSRKLQEFLQDALLSRRATQGYVSQCVLTPTGRYIALRFLSSLRKTAKVVDKKLQPWIVCQCPGPIDAPGAPKVNVFIADFVNLKEGQFCNWVIELNAKLCECDEQPVVSQQVNE